MLLCLAAAHGAGRLPASAGLAVALVPDREPQYVMADGTRTVRVVWRNTGDESVDVSWGFRLYQASSSTAAGLGDRTWKRLRVPAGQTVLESATLTLPAVRAETRFLMRWHDEQGYALGVTELIVLPSHLLEELAVLAGDRPLALVDPLGLIRPLLRRAAVQFEDLDPEGLGRYRGRLAIAGSDRLEPGAGDSLAANVRQCLKAGVNVVWFHPRTPAASSSMPVCLVRSGVGTLVLADRAAFAPAADTAVGQRTLISLARLAVNPEASLPFPP